MNKSFSPHLISGQTIGICAPSSSITPERFQKGVDILHKRGFKTIIHPQTYYGAESGCQLCGTPEQKAAALMELWVDDNIDGLMVACGGNFSAQILHLLDYDLISRNPKALIGFSDTTALLSSIYAKTGIGGIFGPTVQTLGRIDNLDAVFDGFSGSPYSLSGFSIKSSWAQSGITKEFPVFAATFSVLMSLAGTSYFPNFSGHFLFLEDIGEELSRLDLMLWQLNEVCPLKNLAGLAFGEFVDLVDTGRPLGLDFQQILSKYETCPIITGLPIGHGNRFFPLSQGRKAKIEASPTPRLIFL